MPCSPAAERLLTAVTNTALCKLRARRLHNKFHVLPLPRGLCFCLEGRFPSSSGLFKGHSDRQGQTTPSASPCLPLAVGRDSNCRCALCTVPCRHAPGAHSCNSHGPGHLAGAPHSASGLDRHMLCCPLTCVPLRSTPSAELWTTSHSSLVSSFLVLSVPPSNLFKRHWIIPAPGVNFFLIKVNCHLFLTLIFNTRHLVLVMNVTHVEKCKLSIGAHGYRDVSVDTADGKAVTGQTCESGLGSQSGGR